MEFGDGYLAEAGQVYGFPSECVFQAGEIITQVRVDTRPANGWNISTGMTFITSQRTCAGGPVTGNTQVFTGEQLLYVKGSVGGVFDQLSFVFSSC